VEHLRVGHRCGSCLKVTRENNNPNRTRTGTVQNAVWAPVPTTQSSPVKGIYIRIQVGKTAGISMIAQYPIGRIAGHRVPECAVVSPSRTHPIRAEYSSTVHERESYRAPLALAFVGVAS
jgi:hypothetical protein